MVAAPNWQRRIHAADSAGHVDAGHSGAERSGKSYTASVQAEELLRHKQQIATIDPTGAWWGLRFSAAGDGPGCPVVVSAGITRTLRANLMLAGCWQRLWSSTASPRSSM